MASTTFEKTENHVAQSLRSNPDSTKAFSKELHDIQGCETKGRFQQDMGRLNDDLHKQGLLPNLQIVQNEKTSDFEIKKMDGAKDQGALDQAAPAKSGDKNSLIEGAQKTLADPKASAADKLSTVENLSKNSVKSIKVADGDGKMRDYSIETEKSGNRQMVHLYGKDNNGQSQVALRGVDNGDGTFSHEKDSRGRDASYEGSNWVESGHGKSNVGTVSDAQKAALKSPDGTPMPNDGTPGPTDGKPKVTDRPDGAPTRTGQPTDGTTPEKHPPSAPTVRAPGSIDRSQFDSQLNDPRVMAAFAGRMNSEVGSQGPAAQTAFAEEVMNRAASRGQNLMQALSGKYYPSHHPGSSTNPEYVSSITNAWKNGTDTTHGATGNASGHVGFGVRGGHYDAQKHWVSPNQTARISGERFGYEKVDLDRGWLETYESLKKLS